MTKKKDKLDKLNVPELFYSRFVADIPRGTSAVVDRLHDTVPQKRGRGLSRVLEKLTEEQWNDVYQLAAKGRAEMKKTQCKGDTSRHREETLFPAICAKTLAARMEEKGVANPVPYIAKKTSRRTKAEIEAARAGEEAATQATVELPANPAPEAVVVPVDPPKLERVDVPESTPSEQEAFKRDMALGQ